MSKCLNYLGNIEFTKVLVKKHIVELDASIRGEDYFWSLMFRLDAPLKLNAGKYGMWQAAKRIEMLCYTTWDKHYFDDHLRPTDVEVTDYQHVDFAARLRVIGEVEWCSIHTNFNLKESEIIAQTTREGPLLKCAGPPVTIRRIPGHGISRSLELNETWKTSFICANLLHWFVSAYNIGWDLPLPVQPTPTELTKYQVMLEMLKNGDAQL